MSEEEKQKRPKFEPKPLDHDQVDLAKGLVKENNPLEGYPMTSVFPFLAPLSCCCPAKDEAQDSDKNQTTEPLLDGKGGGKGQAQKKKNDKAKGAVEEDALKKDPYLLLGSGMIAYRDLLFTLTLVFSLLSIIMIPAMLFFNSYKGILLPKPYMAYSIGNMGYSSSMCSIMPLGAGNLVGAVNVPVSCPPGASYDSTFSSGINPKDLFPNNFCQVYDTGSDISNVECSEYVNQTYISE